MSTQTEPKLVVYPEDTPNPLSNRFALNRSLLKGAGRDFPNRESAECSPLAREIFMIPGVSGVYIGENFVTVSVQPNNNWWALRPLIIQTIECHFASGQPAINDGPTAAEPLPQKALTPIEAGILRVLETEIQPAVAMDGGYIALAGYDKGVVRLHLRGSCHSCPSATVTLKMGIENRLKQEFPEIVSVEAV